MEETIGFPFKKHFTLSDIPDTVQESVMRYIYYEKNHPGPKTEQWRDLMYKKFTQDEIQSEYNRQTNSK
jgi:sarcosine oxidase delta subunit